MSSMHHADSLPEGWLAFELGVLRRLQFRSVAIPFAGEADLDFNLTRWGVRVAKASHCLNSPISVGCVAISETRSVPAK